MADHIFGVLDQVCVGCGLAAREAVDLKKVPECPAYYGEIVNRGEKCRLVIRPADESLTVWRADGTPLVGLDQSGMFGLRDQIDWGVRQIRKAKGK